MKITSAVIFINLLLFNFSFAQDYPRGFKLGIQAGYSLVKFRANWPDAAGDGIDHKFRSSFNFNLFAKYQFGRVGISIEPGFVRKGSNHPYGMSNVINFSYVAKYKLDYIVLPVLLNINLGKKFSVGAGVEAGFFVKAKHEYHYGTLNDAGFLYNKNINFSGLVGVDYCPFHFLDIALRYGHGLTSIQDIIVTDNTGNELGEAHFYNQVIQLSIRFNFINPK